MVKFSDAQIYLIISISNIFESIYFYLSLGMLIDLEVEREPQSDELGRSVMESEFTARLIFRLPGTKVTYRNYSYNSPEDAILNTLNSFLAGRDFEAVPEYPERLSFGDGLQFSDNIPLEIRDIISQAIDLKTNAQNKLTP